MQSQNIPPAFEDAIREMASSMARSEIKDAVDAVFKKIEVEAASRVFGPKEGSDERDA